MLLLLGDTARAVRGRGGSWRGRGAATGRGRPGRPQQSTRAAASMPPVPGRACAQTCGLWAMGHHAWRAAMPFRRGCAGLAAGCASKSSSLWHCHLAVKERSALCAARHGQQQCSIAMRAAAWNRATKHGFAMVPGNALPCAPLPGTVPRNTSPLQRQEKRCHTMPRNQDTKNMHAEPPMPKSQSPPRAPRFLIGRPCRRTHT